MGRAIGPAMNTRLLVAFASVASIAFLQGCQATVVNDGDDGTGGGGECGERPADTFCGSNWECVDGEWEQSGGDFCAECPDQLPSDGAECPYVGFTCEYYEDVPCGPSGEVTVECTEDGWVTYWPRCQPEPECPVIQPEHGADCSEWYNAYWCEYPSNCGGSNTFHCDFGSDPATWVLDTQSPDCPVDCTAAADIDTCGGLAGCQWLTPGCASEGEQAIAEGCYPVADCAAEGAPSCGDESICAAFVYNPCEGLDCRACGATYNTCVPALLGD